MSAGTLLQQIGSACRDGRLGATAIADIKAYLASPFKQSGGSQATSASAATTAATAPGLNGAAATSGFGGFPATTQQQKQQQQQPFALLGSVGDTPVGQVGSLELVNEHVGRARVLLSLLVLCGEPEKLTGVNETLASVASLAASNILQFIRAELSSTSLLMSGHSSVSPVFSAHGKSNPILLTAQCLLLLTRHFQMQESFVRELCGILELLMEEVRRHMHAAVLSMDSFRQHPSTAGISAVSWLLTASLVNSMAVWKQLRGNAGQAKENTLLHSNLATEVEEWVRKLRSKVEHSQMSGSLSFSAAGHRKGGQPKLPVPLEARVKDSGRQRFSWVSILEGYLSIILLGVGVFLCGKGDERGLDRAVEAFLGDRCQSPFSENRGKVMKYFVQLAPLPSLLVVPAENIYIIPYEIIAYTFDEMLLAIKHVADNDVRSCVRYLESLQAGTDAPQCEEFGTVNTPFSTAAGGGGLQQYSVEKMVQDQREPFFSEMAHILQALTACLENLPSDVLNPDMDADCAVTFFIFKNCVTHMRSVFQTQRPNVIWESYTLKILTSFLDVLAMIGRNPQYTERVVALFGEMQVECTELQWSSLIGQAQECTGVSGGVSSLLWLDVGGSMSAIKKPTGATASRHRQFTQEYLLEKQQRFVASVFTLLCQIATHPLLRDQVRYAVTLDTALNFLYAPRLSQPVLGKVLSLIGSLITNHEEASRVWSLLEENHLLRPVTEASGGGGAAAAGGGGGGRWRQSDTGDVKRRANGGADDNNTAVTVEARSLLGHCQYECHHGTYSITIGFLGLMIAFFKYHTPGMEHLPIYTLVTRFIAEEIFRGVLRRFFASADERYTVAALAAATLTRALTLRLAFTGDKSMVPFTVVMACAKAPADVLGEALQIISEAATAPNELLNYQRAAVRQCLALLRTAITVKEEQGLDTLFTFDARTASNTELAAQLLPLSASVDSLVVRKSLQLLLLIPQPTVSQATRHWFVRPDALEAVITPFVTALRPDAVSSPIIHVPPALAVLDHDEVQLLLPHAEVETKSLILDLLIQHALAPQTSITSWLCGYPLYGSTEELLTGYCLEPIIAGANSREVEERHPHIAIKYVKLVYLLRANPSLSTPSLQRLMKRRGNDKVFYVLQTLRPDQCSPLILNKYAFVMKLLALDIFSIGTKTPEELQVSLYSTPNSSLVELLFLLLHVSPQLASRKSDEFASPGVIDIHERGIAVDFAQWPTFCLKSLPLFPTNCVAPGGAEGYIFRANDDTPQYSIPRIYEAVQRESQMSNKRSLSTKEIRERLSVFVRANECLAAYAGGVQFIEGWCALANISVTVLDKIQQERILYLAHCLLESVQLTSSLTVAAQEQIVYQLSQTLSTLMAQLKRQAVLAKEGALVRVPQNGAQGSMVASGRNIGNETIMDGGVGVSRRTRNDRTSIPQLSAVSQTAQRSFTETTDGYSRASKRDATGTLILSKQDVTDMFGRSLIDPESLQLLKTLLLTTVQWGPRVGMARQHFYSAVMAFLGTPGASLDDIALQRHHRALFDVLVQDIASASSGGNKLAALALLAQLLHFSPQLCEMLCISSTGDGTSPQLMTCITSAFQAIDESISAFFAHGGTEVASILWLAQTVFDLLMIISQQHAVQLIQINALSHCIAMKVWNTSARVVLGHTNSHAETDAFGSENVEVYREVIKSVLLFTTRWFNVILSALDNSEAALVPVAEFVRSNQLLFQSVLSSPYLDYHRRYVDSLTLGLFVEIGGMLYRLSCSPLVDECRALVHLFALTDLLALLTKSEFVESPIFATDAATPLMPVSSPLSGSQTGSLPSPSQRQQISVAVQNILRFLLRAENLGALFAGWGENGFAATDAGGTGGEQPPPRLSDDARSKTLMVTITEQVVATMENAYYSGVVQAVHFVPHLVALHSLVLFLHAFLLLDRAAHVRDVRSQWGPIVHALEEAQRVVNLWKAFHSDYIKGVRVSRAGDGRWSVAAPSISNQSTHLAISAPPQEDSHTTSTYHQQLLDTPTRRSLKQVTDSAVERSFTNQLSTVTLAAVGGGAVQLGTTGDASCLASDAVTLPPAAGDVSIGALVEPTRRTEVLQSDVAWGVYPARDEVLNMESLLRQVKVAISNALRVASRT
ncbi:uncharacterized protein Tco025E_00712 [Trypanosoma conorhini]|uniref:Uncharacterized protein n=1 Tax=Trypanosoma conorhini TaxID=83891 RepID=A0A3R7LLG7_9TRYP|nr:uncharacterized protein Tco025E_00712 [Trypanosoma conorhini]RNF27028.1 hypothetical protein Tco025E_00712 [Trypanosoma conorhini]